MDLTEMLLSPGDAIRYGVSPAEKADAEFYGVPGGFEGVRQGNPYAARESSAFLGAQKWGEAPANLFNNIAFQDLGANWLSMLQGNGLDSNAYNRHLAGQRGAAAGARAGQQAQMASASPMSEQDLLSAILSGRGAR